MHLPWSKNEKRGKRQKTHFHFIIKDHAWVATCQAREHAPNFHHLSAPTTSTKQTSNHRLTQFTTQTPQPPFPFASLKTVYTQQQSYHLRLRIVYRCPITVINSITNSTFLVIIIIINIKLSHNLLS